MSGEQEKKPGYSFAGHGLTQKQRMDIYRQQAEAIGPRVDPPLGKPRTRDELLADLKAEQQVKDRLAQSVRDRVPTGPVNPFANRLAELEGQRAHCSPMDRPAVHRRLRVYRKAAEDWQAEQDAIAARAEYDALPTIALMREHAEAFSRSPPPGADPAAVALAVATAKSSLFSGDGSDQAAAYWRDIAAIEAAAETRQRVQLGEQVQSAKVNIGEVETATGLLADTEARAEHARQQLAALEGGGDGA